VSVSGLVPVAGLSPITEVSGIENVDLSDIVRSHDEYPLRMEAIFTRLRFY